MVPTKEVMVVEAVVPVVVMATRKQIKRDQDLEVVLVVITVLAVEVEKVAALDTDPIL
tara:strand:+ start:319 stop:492 length:174 start_codon:yes stop_codon:yes gene_type:complete